MMSPFKPAGDQARWLVLYGLLRVLDVGDVLTYDEMGTALELDPVKDRHVMQLAMRRAALELERVDKRVADARRNVGYRIVEPPEQLGIARRHQRKAGRSLARGQGKAANVDFNLIDTETRRAFELVASAFAAQLDFNRRMDVRQANLERAVEAVTKDAGSRIARTDAELVELRERLARLEEQRTSGSK